MDNRAAGADLRRRRERRGWSREVLAEKSGVSASAIQNYEAGERDGDPDFKPQPGKLRQLANAYGYPEGAEILQLFDLADMAEQFEREALTGADDFGRLTPGQQETLREINRLMVALVTNND